MLNSFKSLGCNANIKVYYVHSYIDIFLKNLRDTSEEHSEGNQQNIKTMEDRYKGRCATRMMADYCRSLKKYCSKYIQESHGKEASDLFRD